jgi:3-isopropylmalate/(R)-2-methylmalate dehydratase large subunit
LPILTYDPKMLEELEVKDGDRMKINFITGEVVNLRNGKKSKVNPFSEIQLEIYKNGGLF